jgi:hypothetical protein
MSILETNAGESSGQRRASLLLLTAIAITFSFFAATSQAQGSQLWTNEGVPLEENAEAQINGQFHWNNPGGKITCGVEGAVTLMPGGEGEVDSFKFVSCSGVGAWNGCKFETVNMSTPWPFTAESGVISAGSVSWQWKVSNCYLPNETWTIITSFDFTPDNEEAISLLHLHDANLTWITPRGTAYTAGIGGQFEFTPYGAYGIQ